jgi:hypothetical protein
MENFKMNADEKPDTKSDGTNADRRSFLRGAAAGLMGAAALAPGLTQLVSAQSGVPSNGGNPLEGSTREQLRKDMMAGIEDDIKKDLDMRAKATEELPRPKNLRDGGMLEAQFPVYYKTSVPEAMRLLTEYFAAYNDRDMVHQGAGRFESPSRGTGKGSRARRIHPLHSGSCFHLRDSQPRNHDLR